jgi:hypothetical protein
MATKENKGGLLSNEDIENDLKAKGVPERQNGYRGTQDTGDDTIRPMGTEVQKRDGQPEEGEDE